MSDSKIEVTLSGKVEGAEDIRKFSAAIQESIAAGDDASGSLKTLGKVTAEARREQVLATEATRRAKDEQALLNATITAFGPKSREAAAAAARFAQAEREAHEAAEKAVGALTKLKDRVEEAAKAEDGELTPATKRAAKELDKLAKDAERDGNDLQKLSLSTKKASGGFDIMGMASGKLMSVLGPAALGGTVLALVGGIFEAADAAFQYDSAMANLPFSLEGATKATHGLISQQVLLNSASSAVALGVTKTAGEFEALGGASVKLAAKLGQPADQLLNNLVTALGRGSTELLDNAGIVLKVGEAHERYAESIGKTVEQLTAEEKASAFKTEALKAIMEAADKTTVSFDTNAAALMRLKTTADDAWEATKRGAVNAFGAVVAGAMSSADALRGPIEAAIEMQNAADAMTREMMRAEGWSQGFKDLASTAGEAAVEILIAKGAVAGFAATWEQGKVLLEQEKAKKEVLSEEAKQAERIQRAMERINKENDSFLDQQAYDALKGPQPAKEKKKKSGGGSKKKEEDVGRGLGEAGAVSAARMFDGTAVTNDMINDRLELEVQAERDAAQELYDIKTLGLDRDLEILEARGLAEEDALSASQDIMDRRLEAEQQLAQQQLDLAKTDAQREAAQTKLEDVEHKKRIAQLKKVSAEEQKIAEKKAAVQQKVAGLVQDLGSAMVDAAWAAAEGEKGAGLQALADFAKSVSKKYALIGLAETAAAAVAAAGVVTAPLAAGHVAAAAMAFGVAAAAGGAAVGLGAAAKSVKGSDKPDEEYKVYEDSKDAPSKGGSSGGGKSKELDGQDVPVSFYDGTKSNAGAAQSNLNYNIMIQGGTWIGSGSAEQTAQDIRKLLEQGKSAGKR